MARYIILRILQGLVTAFVLLTMIFVFARLSGDPVNLIVRPDANLAERAEAARRLGLDQPYIVQYFKYLGDLFQGNFGESIQYSRSATDMFVQAFPNTVRITVLAMALAMAIGIPMGVVSATRRGRITDHIVRGVSAFGISAPEFWIGMMLILIFAVKLGVVPVSGKQGPSSYILPSVALSVPILAGTARLVRSSLIESLESEYIRLARIKGASNTVVVWRHGVRNALLPVVTFLGINLANLLGGSVAIETVFSWPGVGRLYYGAVQGQDYPLEQGLLLILGFIVIGVNLVVDILYTYIDPRIRYHVDQVR
jgi:peptide/nickel transport system permease protein